MKYDVICSNSLDDVINWINKKLVINWKPLGGIVIIKHNENYVTFYQTIVKEPVNATKCIQKCNCQI